MKPVQQSLLGHSGNCVAACIATIAELPLYAVDFSCSDYPGGRWVNVARDKLRPHGLTIFHVELQNGWVSYPRDVPFVVHGPSARGLRHAVVAQWECIDGQDFRKILWDPYPDGLAISHDQAVTLVLPLHLPERS